MADPFGSRRDFLTASGAFAGAAWLSAQFPDIALAAREARSAEKHFTALTPQQARELEAVADCIIPGDKSAPGAREAGVIWFIDGALSGAMAGMKSPLLAGMGELVQAAGESFSELAADRQIQLLTAREQSPFFGMMRLLTLAGMFAMPSHGGNADRAGWKLLGFDHRHAWAPPFGHYDAHQHDGES